MANLEYRWRIQALLDAVLFLDEGQIFRDGGFDLDDFESAWGGGLRGVIRNNTVLRLEVGTSDEGTRVFFKFSRVFQIV